MREMKFLICFFTAMFALTVTTLADETWIGFKPVEEVNLPFNAYLENSVVQIATVGDFGGRAEKVVSIVDIKEITPVKDYKKLAPSKDPMKIQPNLRAIQIEACRKQSLRYCPVFAISSVSTGFFEDGTKLNTCRHAFHNWLVEASKANGDRPVETLSPPIILYSKDRKVLYNAATVPADQMLKFSFMNTDPRINVLDFGKSDPLTKAKMNYNASDVTQMVSSRAFVPAQSVNYDFNVSAWDKTIEFYSAGYPGKTNYFPGGKGDTPGGILVVSSGTLSVASPTQSAFESSVRSKTGMSGAPVFRSDGRIIGIIFTGGSNSTLSIAMVPNPSALQKIWSQMEF